VVLNCLWGAEGNNVKATILGLICLLAVPLCQARIITNDDDDPNNEWGINLRINMGTYGGTAEASMPPYEWAILGDITNDGILNFVDFAYQAEEWHVVADERPGDLDRSGTVDINDVALSIDDWLRETVWKAP
jgi:hypothetical protein